MTSAFIVFEGPDGAGTSLHSKLLAERLQEDGKMVLLTAEPTNGPIGSAIREELKTGKEISSEDLQRRFCEDRARHIEHEIAPALSSDTVVICDRYILSTLAYGQAQGLPLDLLKSMNTNFIQPDIHFLLLPPLAVCTERLSRRKETDALEEKSFQEKVYALYKQMAKDDASIQVINTDGEKETIANEIYRSISL